MKIQIGFAIENPHFLPMKRCWEGNNIIKGRGSLLFSGGADSYNTEKSGSWHFFAGRYAGRLWGFF